MADSGGLFTIRRWVDQTALEPVYTVHTISTCAELGRTGVTSLPKISVLYLCIWLKIFNFKIFYQIGKSSLKKISFCPHWICLKISRLFLKFWTIAISYSMFQQSKLTHRMLNWHQTDRPSATINYNLSPTTILPRDLITFQLSHIATVSYSIDQSASSHRASWPTECWPEITLTGLVPQSTPPPSYAKC